MEFRTLHLEDKAAVNDVLLPLGRNDSALGFANLYSLTEKYGTQIALEDGVLYVRQLDRIPGAVAYYPPLGTLDIADDVRTLVRLSLIHISEPTRQAEISYAVFCLKKKKHKKK